MKLSLLCLLFIIIGCSYPQYQIQKLDELTFQNKRGGHKITNIKEFIRPEETIKTLEQIEWGHTEKDTILNILYYVQQIKQTSDSRDFWQYPKETIQKGGDCEDKTFLLLSMLNQAGINGAQGVKGRFWGQGHMWVEYQGNILDPSRKRTKLIPTEKSTGYVPFFKFDQNNVYYCNTRKEKQ